MIFYHYGFCHGTLIISELFSQLGLAEGKHLHCQQACIVCRANANGGHGDSRRHLDNGKQTVQPIHKGGLDGQADHRHDGLSRQNTAQMGCLTSRSDNHAKAVFLGVLGKLLGLGRSTVGGEDPRLKRNTELLQLNQ